MLDALVAEQLMPDEVAAGFDMLRVPPDASVDDGREDIPWRCPANRGGGGVEGGMC